MMILFIHLILYPNVKKTIIMASYPNEDDEGLQDVVFFGFK